MTYVDEAFSKCKAALEITATESAFASRKHVEIRDLVSASWDLDDDFLTGSYRRNTKTKRLKDVDIFVVLKPAGAQTYLRQRPPTEVLAALKALLEAKYDKVTADGFACTVTFSDEDEVASFDVVPAFKRKGGGWEIPDADRSGWISTNPKRHHEQSTAKNEKCDGKFVPFVKMIKGINREAGEPVGTSFLLEVMAHSIIRTPFGRYQDEIVWFLASAVDQSSQDWEDPAKIGPAVNGTMTASQRQAVSRKFTEWQRVAEEAVRLEDAGEERAAVEKWRTLFGTRMPRS